LHRQIFNYLRSRYKRKHMIFTQNFYYICPVSMQTGKCSQSSLKFSNIKFQQNPFSGSRVSISSQTDRQTEEWLDLNMSSSGFRRRPKVVTNSPFQLYTLMLTPIHIIASFMLHRGMPCTHSYEEGEKQDRVQFCGCGPRRIVELLVGDIINSTGIQVSYLHGPFCKE
jgi:hypothetical protein